MFALSVDIALLSTLSSSSQLSLFPPSSLLHFKLQLLCSISSPHMHATRTTHFTLADFIYIVMQGENHDFWTPSWCNFLNLTTLSLASKCHHTAYSPRTPFQSLLLWRLWFSAVTPVYCSKFALTATIYLVSLLSISGPYNLWGKLLNSGAHQSLRFAYKTPRVSTNLPLRFCGQKEFRLWHFRPKIISEAAAVFMKSKQSVTTSPV